MKVFATTLLLLLCLSSITYASSLDLSDYDVENRVEFDSFTFLPIKDSDQYGVFLYSEFNKDILGPTSAGFGWRSIVVSVLPSALDTQEFNDFIVDNNIIDLRRDLIPSDATLCSLTEHALTKLNEIKAIYTTGVLAGGYPKPCSLVVRYYLYPEGPLEEDILSVFNGSDIITISYSLESEPQLVASVQLHEIVAAFVELGTLVENESGVFEGILQDVIDQSSLLDPLLFGAESESEQISPEAWQLFVDALAIMDDQIAIELTEDNVLLTSEKPGIEIITVDQEI